MSFLSLFNIVLVAFAFGFVIFWHELGHFLAARWAGVRVEQFAVGMGNAIFSWRKGIGFRPGNTQAEFDRRIDAEIAKRKSDLPPAEQDREWSFRERYDVAEQMGLGQTDYRFNWIPLGGYVKPTGQDDLRPAKEVAGDDPHAFGAKPVYKRMVIISAGVIMNVILAFALYVALFLHGFKAPPAIVGQVLPNSPAQKAGLLPGDEILSINGRPQQDYAKLKMHIALLRDDEPSKFVIQRPGEGQTRALDVTPLKNPKEGGLPAVGVIPADMLVRVADTAEVGDLISPDLAALPPGAQVVAVAGRDVSKDADAHVLANAVNAAGGRTVDVTIKEADGTTKPLAVRSSLMPTINDAAIAVAGLQPRVRINALVKDAPAQKAGVQVGDVIAGVSIIGSGETLSSPPLDGFMTTIATAVKEKKKVRLTVERGGKAIDAIEIDPATSIIKSHPGIGVAPDIDLGTPVIADVVSDTAAEKAGLKAGHIITAIDGKNVASWPDVIDALKAGGREATLTVSSAAGKQDVKLPLDDAAHAAMANLVFAYNLPLTPLQTVRRTTNPIVAAQWGFEETRASLLQVYMTLRRLVEGSVPLSNLSGPVGIFSAGTSAASRGIDWLIWFTALISANLAVVNFLPIPIVDGGLFTFLCIEKITGRPPSPKVQATAQIVGIVLLGSLFLFVTYHDILRQIHGV